MVQKCDVMFFFSSRRRHTRYIGDWSSDVCSSDLANREAIRSLNLSRSQMQELRGVMQGYQSELEDILTSEQQQQLADLKEDMQDESATDDPPDLVTELDLSADQASQLDSLQVDMTDAVQGILSAEQFEEAQDLGLLGL